MTELRGVWRVDKARGLAAADIFDSGADAGGGFGLLFARDLAELDRRDLELDIYAVEQGAGDSVAIALDLDETAAALALRVSEEAALAGVRCLSAISHSE